MIEDDNNRLLKIEDKVNLLLLLIIRSVNKLARFLEMYYFSVIHAASHFRSKYLAFE